MWAEGDPLARTAGPVPSSGDTPVSGTVSAACQSRAAAAGTGLRAGAAACSWELSCQAGGGQMGACTAEQHASTASQMMTCRRHLQVHAFGQALTWRAGIAVHSKDLQTAPGCCVPTADAAKRSMSSQHCTGCLPVGRACVLLAGGGAPAQHLAGAVVLVVHVPVRRAVILLPACHGAAASPAGGTLLLVGTWASLAFCTGRQHAHVTLPGTSRAWHLRLQIFISGQKGCCCSAQAGSAIS